jgi:hypothetical protein
MGQRSARFSAKKPWATPCFELIPFIQLWCFCSSISNTLLARWIGIRIRRWYSPTFLSSTQHRNEKRPCGKRRRVAELAMQVQSVRLKKTCFMQTYGVPFFYSSLFGYGIQPQPPYRPITRNLAKHALQIEPSSLSPVPLKGKPSTKY